MHSAFLGNVAGYLVSRFGQDLSGIAVVLPNRRGGLFLKQYLAGIITGTTWAPEVFSVEDFILLLSGLRKAEQIHCLLELYNVHREIEGEKAQKFDDFLNWGQQLLSDFNEVDRYLVDPKSLFNYLDNVRTLSVWNPDNATPTEFQLNYLRFYKSLLPYYSRLKQRLLEKGEAYQGLIFRRAWENLSGDAPAGNWNHIVFAGFNALTTAEEKIFGLLVDRGVAALLWDADRYYLEDQHQEAGQFLREWHRKWPGSREQWIADEFRQGRRDINVTGVPDAVGQVKYCGELLQQLAREGVLDERTAIVLPDENLLIPLLNSLPEEVKEVNITMGLPLGMTPVADLLNLVFLMHLNTTRIRGLSSQPGKFYYRDVLNILRHPYINRLASVSLQGNPFPLSQVISRIRTGGLVFLRKEDLAGEETGLFLAGFNFLETLLGSWETLRDAITGMQQILELLHSIVCSSGGKVNEYPGVEEEYLFAIARIVNQLNDFLQESSDILNWQTFYRFFRQMLDTTKLPFYGEPLRGVQIMGMLETRNLDFERVILLSCNEGVLPSGRGPQSFIPFDVKRDFLLPTYRQKDAVYAYHFYRLLQRARQAWLIYTTEPDQLGGGEISRYVKQIAAELVRINPGIQFQEQFLVSPVIDTGAIPEIQVAKEGNVWERMVAKAGEGLSPTALNSYRRCPLRFYYAEIAGLKEPEEITDEIDPQTLGSVVHTALERLYEPYTGRLLAPGNLKEMENIASAEVDKAFGKIFKGESLDYGKNHLLVQVAKIMIRRFIRQEQQFLKELADSGESMTILLLEKLLYRTLRVDTTLGSLIVKIKGFVDRVDRIDSVTRIIDYKSGKVEKKEIQIREWKDLFDNPGLDKGFQLMMYAWLLSGGKYRYPIRAGIVSLQQQGNGMIGVTVPAGSAEKETSLLHEAEMNRMENILLDILGEIYDPDLPFRQTGDRDQCRICPFISLCGR